MDTSTTLRGNGTGFMHLSRRLQPGENVPALPSLVDQLMACRHNGEAASAAEQATAEDEVEESDEL